MLITALTQLSENFQHANVRLWFGYLGERVWVSTRFHRLNHSVGIGHDLRLCSRPDNPEPPGVEVLRLGGHNFGVLRPWWVAWFGTANFELRSDSTGVRDQVEPGRDNGSGFWSLQWLGLMRLLGRT